jgi:hypothetical protein
MLQCVLAHPSLPSEGGSVSRTEEELTLTPGLVCCNDVVNDGRVLEPLPLRLSELQERASGGV